MKPYNIRSPLLYPIDRKSSGESVEFELCQSIADVTEEFAIEANSKDLELSFFISPDVPPMMVGNEDHLQQILAILIGNAIQVTQRGEVVVAVDWLSSLGGEVELLFTVTHTGPGVPLDQRETIFEGYYRDRPSCGLGLGLGNASHLVRRMGGRIWLNSVEGQGSVFHFTVRLGILEIPAQRVAFEDIGLGRMVSV